MRKNVHARRSASLSVLVLALVGVATPAGATTPTETVHETWDETYVNVCDGGTADTSDDLTIESRGIGSGDFVLRERGDSGLFYGTFDGQESVTYTNVDNDLYWTSTNRWHEKDLRVTEDEDGILTISVGRAFHFKVFSADGVLGGVNTGRVEFVVVYDPATDTEISFTVAKDVGERSVQDSCEDAFLYTT